MTKNRYAAGLLVLAGLLLGGGPTARGRVLALESHSQPRSSRVASMTATVIRNLGTNVLAGKALTKRLAQLYGRTPRPLFPERRAQILTKLKIGAEAAHVGEWKKAIRLLVQVKQALQRAVLSVSRSKKLFAALQRVRLVLSNCYLRSHRPKQAREVMAELLIAQPDIRVSMFDYPPGVFRLFVRIKAALDRRPLASLEVTSNPSGVVVFLSGRYVGLSPVKLDRIYPGWHDLLVIKDRRPSRITRISVRGKQRAFFDLTLHRAISPRFAGLQLTEGPGRDSLETRVALDIAIRVGTRKIILVGLRRIDDREVLVGKAISVDGRTAPVKAFVYVDQRGGPPASTLRSLGRFLSGRIRKPGPGVMVNVRGLSPGTRKPADRAPRRRGRRRSLVIAGLTVAGIGLAATLAGGVLLGIHDRVKRPDAPAGNELMYQTDTEGYALLGAGLGTVAIGALLLVVSRLARRQRDPTRRTRVWLSPRSGGSVIFVGGQF